MIIYPEAAFYSNMELEHVEEIVEEHLVKGNVVTNFLLILSKKAVMV